MEKDEFKILMEKLDDIKNLLMLIASKNKATSDEIGKSLGLSDSYIRGILTGAGKKYSKKSKK